MVIQHDWAFLRTIPLVQILNVMQKFPDIVKYVGFPSTTSLTYTETTITKIGSEIRSEMGSREATLKLPLYPLLMWFDKTHICRTDHYRSFVFEQHEFKLGYFIEDTVFGMFTDVIRQNGMSAHEKYGTFLYNDGKGEIISHLHGRRFLTQEQRVECGMPRVAVRCGNGYVRDAVELFEMHMR